MEREIVGNILLSIIIPIYNQERFLAKCLDSILANHIGGECEVVLIDDGSTDSSGEIIDGYTLRIKNCTVRHTCNRGVAAARNLGLDLAQGRYIAWIDPDDYISTDWYMKLRPILLSGIDLVYFDMWIVYPEKVISRSYGVSSCVLTTNSFLWDLQADTIQSHLCSKVFARELWDGIRFPVKTAYCEDYSVMHEVAVRANKIQYLHAALYYYVQHPFSIVHKEEGMLEYCILEIKLSKQRYVFIQSCGYCLNPAGIWIAQIQFLWKYSRATKALKKQYMKEYLLARREIKRSLISIVFSMQISARWKVKAVLSLLS